ncbi:MAG: phosphate signaling complex protein PhoU [Melioribacteraceae bacterium]|nr:phosphate signaling complex protein PhoU [Melioribacteraceae bacterium]
MERPIDIHIEKLKTRLIKMCSLVDDQVDKAIEEIVSGKNTVVNEIEIADRRVDKFDLKIDRIIHRIIALNQPVAVDLRLLLSAMKININLERIGDLAVNISRTADELKLQDKILSNIKFEKIAGEIKHMLKLAFDSFINNDTDLAKNLFVHEENLDRLVDFSQNKLVEIMKEDPAIIDEAMKINSILEELERIGDHATNIGKEVYFIVSSKSLKHLDSDDINSLDDI